MKIMLCLAATIAALLLSFGALAPAEAQNQDPRCPPGTTDPTYCEGGPPEAITGNATVTTTSVTLNGSIDPNGQPTEYQFEYSTSQTFDTFSTSPNPPGVVPAGDDPERVSTTITGLTCGTRYYYRLRGTNASGTDLGATRSFVACQPGSGSGGGGGSPSPSPSASPSPNGSPTVDTTEATNITQTSATVSGTVNSNGSATTYSFQYGTNTNYQLRSVRLPRASVPAQSAGSGTSTTKYFADLTGLTPGTLYHYRIVATNANGTSLGDDQTFRTLSRKARGKKRPKLSLRVKPRHDKAAPYRYRARGKLRRGDVRKSARCRGKVRVRITRGNKLIAKKTVRVKRNCAYRARLTAGQKLSRAGSGRMRMRARFMGNSRLLKKKSNVVRIKYGPKPRKIG